MALLIGAQTDSPGVDRGGRSRAADRRRSQGNVSCSGHRAEPGQGHFDQPVNGLRRCQTGGRFEGMKADINGHRFDMKKPFDKPFNVRTGERSLGQIH